MPHANRTPLLAAVVALGSIAIVMSAFWLLAQSADSAAKTREQTLVANGLAERVREAENTAMTETMWDDAVRALDLKFDPAWAKSNVGEFFSETAGFELSFVLNGADKPIFAHEGRATKPPAAFDRFANAAAPLVAAVRKGEAARAPFDRVSNTGAPIQASAVIDQAGALYILTATLVQPDFGHVLPSARAPIVITGEAIDAGFLRRLSGSYLLDGLTLAPPRAVLSAQDARIALRNGATVLALLRWKPQQPGAALFAKAALPLLSVLTIFAGVALALWLRSSRLAIETRAAQARAEAARAADVAKSAFLAKMSHELRTPLNAIIEHSESLQAAAAAAQRTQDYAAHDRVLIAARNLLALINDLLDLSRIEAGRLDIFPIAFDAGQLCVELTDQMRPAAEANGNALLFAPDSALGPVRTDPRLLKQCLANLITNACKVTKDGRVTLRAERQREDLVFQICDTGPGLGEEQIARQFAPFAQGGPDIRDRFGGSGLGLALTRELARVLGGGVTVMSDPTYGSVFTLRVRASLAASANGEQVAA